MTRFLRIFEIFCVCFSDINPSVFKTIPFPTYPNQAKNIEKFQKNVKKYVHSIFMEFQNGKITYMYVIGTITYV